jgi:hypothetical protein
VKECADSGESWVAIDDSGCITGFLLVEPDKMERFHRDNQALHLRYAAVVKSQRKQGIFRALIQQVMNRKVPMTAEDTIWIASRLSIALPCGPPNCEPAKRVWDHEANRFWTALITGVEGTPENI